MSTSPSRAQVTPSMPNPARIPAAWYTRPVIQDAPVSQTIPRQAPDLAHKRVQDFTIFLLLARRKMIAETHPVQFQAVRVIPFQQFPDKLQVMFADFRNAIVKGTVRPPCAAGDTPYSGCSIQKRL